MKKIFTIILAAVMLLTALTACKPSSSDAAHGVDRLQAEQQS